MPTQQTRSTTSDRDVYIPVGQGEDRGGMSIVAAITIIMIALVFCALFYLLVTPNFTNDSTRQPDNRLQTGAVQNLPTINEDAPKSQRSGNSGDSAGQQAAKADFQNPMSRSGTVHLPSASSSTTTTTTTTK